MANILVIAAHPDDEVIGLGGTIIKHVSGGDKVFLSIITDGGFANYQEKGEKLSIKRKKECLQASKTLGIAKVFFHDLPDAKLDTIPQTEINKILEEDINRVKPAIVYTHNSTDLHSDHRIVCASTKIAARKKVKELYSYEIISSSINFNPEIYIDISKELSKKLKALKCYKSLIKKPFHPFSPSSLKAVANLRGLESGLKFAEAFKCIKKIII